MIITFAYIALWKQRPAAGGYDVTDAVTYVWLGQAMIMTVAVWGGGATDDLAARIRTGDVAIDLYRPVNLLGWWLASDLGRAAYHLLTRGLAPTLVGALLFDLRFPAGPLAWLAFAVSVPLAVLVSFAIRCWSRQRLLAARRHRAAHPAGGVRDVLLRAHRAAGALPRLDPRPRPGAALGVVPPGAGRHLARPADRPDASPALASRLPGPRAAGLLRRLSCGWPPHGGGARWLSHATGAAPRCTASGPSSPSPRCGSACP